MTRTFDSIRSILLWIVAFPVFIVSCLFLLTVSLVYRGRRIEPLIKGCCRLILTCCGIRIRVRGRVNFNPARQYILLMNHVNFFDPFVFYAGFPGRARGLEEESHFRWPLYGLVLRRLGMIPVDRKNSQKARESLKRAAALIRRRPDFSFIVLPEGTRTPDGKLGPFKRGAFILAAESGLDLLPLVQRGAFRINRKGSRLVRPGTVEMLIGPPISAAGFGRENQDKLVEKARNYFLAEVE